MLYQLPLFILLIWVGYVDIKTRRIPNQTNIALFCTALLCQASSAAPSFAMVVANLGLGLLLTLPGYIKGVLGGGDVKLLAALSPAWGPFFLFGSFAVGVLLIGIALTFQKRGLLSSPSKDLTDGIPLGACIATGASLLATVTLIP